METEALKLVRTLNNESFVSGSSLDFLDPFEYMSNGNECAIAFMGVKLWTEGDDERDWVSNYKREPLREFIIKESTKILHDITDRIERL